MSHQVLHKAEVRSGDGVFETRDAEPGLFLVEIRTLEQPNIGDAQSLAAGNQKHCIVAPGPGACDLQQLAQPRLGEELDLATVQGLGGAAFFGGGSPLGLDAVVFGDVAIAAPKVHLTFYPFVEFYQNDPRHHQGFRGVKGGDFG